MNAPLIGGSVTKSWTGTDGDVFTELLSTVLSIDRTRAMRSQSSWRDAHRLERLFPSGSPAFLILSATQADGREGAISVSLTNTSNLRARLNRRPGS